MSSPAAATRPTALLRGAAGEALRYEDPGAGSLREAFLTGDRLERVLFTAGAGPLPPRDWLVEMFASEALTATDRTSVLVGRALGRTVDTSPVVCACRGVRAAKIEAAVEAGAADIDAVTEATSAGSVCGSCRPEIGRMLAKAPAKEVLHAA
jgi:assimilatory nitrate reductase catalytic subunit